MEKKKRLEKFQRGKLFLHRWQMGGLFLLAALTTGLIQMPQQGNLDGLLETAHSTEKQDTLSLIHI